MTPYTTPMRVVLAVALVVASVACGADEPASVATTAAPGTAVAPNSVSIVNYHFQPDDLSVAVGTTVTWTNTDAFAHTATATDGSFDSDNLDTDDATPAPPSYSYTFQTAGTFTYYCNIHNYMTGTVTVTG